MSEQPKTEPIPELVGKTIVEANFVDGGVWFDVLIRTDDGHTITSGGYKADAQASLANTETTLREWDW